MNEQQLRSRTSIRLPEYDYTTAGSYFVTICVRDMCWTLGNVSSGEVLLSPLGAVAADCWRAIPSHCPDITLDEFVIMPNHLHGILVNWAGTPRPATIPDPRDAGVAWRPIEREVRTPEGFGRPVRRSVPTIVRSFKAAATKLARERGLWSDHPLWQRGYYEHVIL